MARVFTGASNATDKTIHAIDRKREQERRYMLSMAFKNAEELAQKLVQRLIDQHIIETTSDRELREVYTHKLRELSNMEDFDVQFKIAPLRSLTPDPNFVSLYLTQYTVEDIVDHPKVRDVFGDDLDVYTAIDSIIGSIRPK